MKKIKDERLILKNLKNVKVAYMIQTFGIIGILGYDLVTKGIEGMTQNPLWIVFMLTTVISVYLSINISVDHETAEGSPKKGFIISLIVITIISIVVGFFVSISEGFGPVNGIIIGGIIFICSLAPILYIYYLRTNRKD